MKSWLLCLGAVAQIVLLSTAAVAAVFVLVLWTAGAFRPLPPRWWVFLIGGAALSGLVLLAGSAAAADPLGWRGLGFRLIGTASVTAAALFVLCVLYLPVDPVVISRRALPGRQRLARLRIVSFNVFHDYPRFGQLDARADKLVAALRALDPTVVVLQEAWSVAGHEDLARRIAGELELNLAYVRANGSRRLIGFEEGSAVLSRLPILEVHKLPLRPHRPFWERRIALMVTLSLDGSSRMLIVGTHLAARDAEVRWAQARDLSRFLPQEGFVVVAGDLNAPRDSPTVDALTSSGLTDVVPGDLDHVLLRTDHTGWTVEGAALTLRAQDLAELIGEAAEISDHPGIVVDFRRVE